MCDGNSPQSQGQMVNLEAEECVRPARGVVDQWRLSPGVAEGSAKFAGMSAERVTACTYPTCNERCAAINGRVVRPNPTIPTAPTTVSDSQSLCSPLRGYSLMGLIPNETLAAGLTTRCPECRWAALAWASSGSASLTLGQIERAKDAFRVRVVTHDLICRLPP